MKNLLDGMLLLLGFVIGAAIVLHLAGCAQPLQHVVARDVFPQVDVKEKCDLGILRGTKDMDCPREFNRKAWL